MAICRIAAKQWWSWLLAVCPHYRGVLNTNSLLIIMISISILALRDPRGLFWVVPSWQPILQVSAESYFWVLKIQIASRKLLAEGYKVVWHYPEEISGALPSTTKTMRWVQDKERKIGICCSKWTNPCGLCSWQNAWMNKDEQTDTMKVPPCQCRGVRMACITFVPLPGDSWIVVEWDSLWGAHGRCRRGTIPAPAVMAYYWY